MFARDSATDTKTPALLVLALLVVGCHHPAFISPEPLAAGDVCASLGVTGYSYGPGEFATMNMMLQARAGLGAGIDAGVRLSIPEGLYGDVKWNFASEPCLFTADLGGSFSRWRENDMTEHFISDTLVWRIQPGLLAGTRTLYGGVRFLLARGYGNKYGHLRPRWSYGPGLLAGASFGDRLRLMPEAEAFWTVSSGFAFVLGVNVELHARTREASGLGW